MGNIFRKIFGVAGGGAGAFTIKDEGVLISSTVESLDIVGIGHNALQTAPTEVTIYAPQQFFVSHWNTSDGNNNNIISDFAADTRYVADPTGGGGFKIGTWSPGDVVNGSNTGVWTYSAGANLVLFDNDTTSFIVIVYDDDGTSILAQHNTGAISGNYSATVNNITITIASWQAEGLFKFKATISVSINISALLPSGGRLTVEAGHALYQKTESDSFYDTDINPATIGNVTIALNTPVTKQLSGVTFFDEGTTWDIAVDDMDWLSCNSWIDALLRFITSNFGITNFNVNSGDVTGFSTLWNNIDDTYSVTKAIDIDEFRREGATTIRGQLYDWGAGPFDDSPSLNLLIDTCENPVSDVLSEHFTTEIFRRLAGFLGSEGLWDSSQNILAYDGNSGAQVIGGELRVPTVDYTSYLPAGNPNYSAGAAPKDFYRRITDVSSGDRRSAWLSLSGTNFDLANLINGNVQIWVAVPGRSDTANPCYVHGAVEYNPGSYDGSNDPCRMSDSTSTNIHISFGSNWGLLGVNNFFIFRIVVVNAIVVPSSLSVSWG